MSYDDYLERGAQDHMEPRRRPTTEELDEWDCRAYHGRECDEPDEDAVVHAMSVCLKAVYSSLSMPNK